MKAPEKIYIQEDKHSTNTYVHPIWYSIDNYGRVEYIRKDALLEWVKEMQELLDTQPFLKEGFRLGVESTLEELTEMINSL